MFNNCTVLSLAATGGGCSTERRHQPLNFEPLLLLLLMPKLLLLLL